MARGRITQNRRAGAPSTTAALDRSVAAVEGVAFRGLNPAPRGERVRAFRVVSYRVPQSTREVNRHALASREGAMTPEEELTELQKKYSLLESDRKAYFETSQWTMKQNKETISGLKKEYKELLSSVAENAATGARSQKENEALAAVGGEELYRLREFSKELKKRHDDLKQSAVRKTRELENRLDSIRDLEVDSVDPATLDSDTTRLIRQLENRLDKALVKFNEASSISQTYEQIIKRLTNERIGFDGQIAGLDLSLKQKEKDLDELILMSHDAGAAKEKAKAELMQVDAQLTKERAEREKALRDRRDTVRKREEMNVEAARMRERRDAEEKRRAEAAKRRAEAAKAADVSAEEKKKKDQRGRNGAYERALMRIKDATGVSDLDQVVSKFTTQENTNRNLRQLREDGQARIEALKEEFERSKRALESLRLGGPAGPASRRAVDDLESRLSAMVVVHDRARARLEMNNKTLVGVAAGATHLVDKLDVLPYGAAMPPVTEATVVRVMAMCEAKMLEALEAARAKGAARISGTSLEWGASAGPRSPGSDVAEHNFRLELVPDPGDDSGDEEGDDSGEEAGEESVPDRELVKASAEAVTEHAEGRKKGFFSAAETAPATPGSVKGKSGRGKRAGLA